MAFRIQNTHNHFQFKVKLVSLTCYIKDLTEIWYTSLYSDSLLVSRKTKWLNPFRQAAAHHKILQHGSSISFSTSPHLQRQQTHGRSAECTHGFWHPLCLAGCRQQFFPLPLMLCMTGVIEFALNACGGGGLRGATSISIDISTSPHMQNTAGILSTCWHRFAVLPVSRAWSTRHAHARDPGWRSRKFR